MRINLCWPQELGSEVNWLSKFHAQCNSIEYTWGNAKKRHRQVSLRQPPELE